MRVTDSLTHRDNAYRIYGEVAVCTEYGASTVTNFRVVDVSLINFDTGTSKTIAFEIEKLF